MSEYGRGPEPDEIEVSIFGPGYGEAIAIHLGDSQWMLVDSCVPQQVGRPALLDYLESIRTPFDAVKVVVASHWHDDHVAGLTDVVTACSSATFFYSSVLSNDEALAFLAAYGDKTTAPQSGGVRQLFEIICNAPNPRAPTSSRIDVYSSMIQGRQVRVAAFSPTTEAQEYCQARMAEFIAKEHEPINHAPDLRPNLEAVVLHIDFGDDAVLLGSDLEDHKNLGWVGIVGNAWCLSKTKGSIYKIAHHGSKTAGSKEIWEKLLKTEVASGLTPFNLGSVSLPTTADKKRIRTASSASFTTSGASKKPSIDRELLRKMNRICNFVVKVNPGFGALRYRKKFGNAKWRVEFFGRAGKL